MVLRFGTDHDGEGDDWLVLFFHQKLLPSQKRMVLKSVNYCCEKDSSSERGGAIRALAPDTMLNEAQSSQFEVLL